MKLLGNREETPLLGSSTRRNRRVRLVVLASAAAGAVVVCTPAGHLASPTFATDWTCDEVQAAEVTPDLCGAPDGLMCQATCLAVDSWCSRLCGHACTTGLGALCVFQRLANLTATCAAVAAMDVESLDGPGFVPAVVPRHLLNCDYNAYCAHCKGDCPTVVARPQAPYTVAGAAASSLNRLDILCARHGIVLTTNFTSS